MTKAERDIRNRKNNSQQLLNDIRYGFQRSTNEHMVRTIKPSEHNYALLEASEFKKETVFRSEDRHVLCFYRDASAKPYVLKDPQLAPAVWRPF